MGAPSLIELSVATMNRHGHRHRYSYGYRCKWLVGADIDADILAQLPFTWISTRISVRMSVSNYPCNGQFDQGYQLDLKDEDGGSC